MIIIENLVNVDNTNSTICNGIVMNQTININDQTIVILRLLLQKMEGRQKRIMPILSELSNLNLDQQNTRLLTELTQEHDALKKEIEMYNSLGSDLDRENSDPLV